MDIWEQTGLVTALAMAGVFLVAEALRRLIPPLARLGLPGSIVAGVLALVAGPQMLGWLPLAQNLLEDVVYHGLALVFIAVALTPADADAPRSKGGVSMAFGVVSMISLQTALGVGLVVALGVLGSGIHPGAGLLLPLGFEQGPGQAMAMGRAWEASGLTDGRQLGLIMAAVGFAWSVLIGVPLVMLGRARGWVSGQRNASLTDTTSSSVAQEAGGVDRLTGQVVVVLGVYAATLGVCHALATGLRGIAPDIAPMVWGFHFIIGALVATGVRPLLQRMGGTPLLDGPLLTRISGLSVDATTACALAAVQIAVLADNWVVIGTLTTVGGLATLLWVLWVAPRAFPEAPFEHALVWFGMSTGTLPMGLALLRVVDPDLRSPAPISAVVGSAGATVGAIPVVLLLHPAIVTTWPDAYPGRTLALIGAVVLYFLGVVGLWRVVGPLRFGAASWRRNH